MREGDTDWERAHLRVERNRGEKFRLGESALDRARRVEVEDIDWERAHLRVGVVWGWETLTERERT